MADAVARATTYLETEVPSMTDTYELAITSYALSRAGSLQAPVALEKLQSMAAVESKT